MEIDKNYLKQKKGVMSDYLSHGNISMARYCEMKGFSIRTFRPMVNYLKSAKEYDLYNAIILKINSVEENKDEMLLNDVFNLLKLIKSMNNGEILTPFEFYCKTNYSVVEILAIADKYLSKENARLFRLHISRIRDISVLSEQEIKNLKEGSHSLRINDEIQEIPAKIKETTLNILDSKNIPITYITFNEACIRYYNALKDANNEIKHNVQ